MEDHTSFQCEGNALHDLINQKMSTEDALNATTGVVQEAGKTF